MALSTGGLTGIILSIILLHVALLVSYYFSIVRNPSKAKRLTFEERYHEKFRWSILALVAVSWIFSVSTTSACTFLKISVPGANPPFVWVGMNSYDAPPKTDGCTRFPTTDDRNNPAFTFAVFNCLLTSVGLFGMMLMQFVLTIGRKRTWLALRVSLYVSLWCCLFTFYIQETDTCDRLDCTLGGAGIAQIFNAIWLVAACVLTFVTPHGDDTGLRTIQRRTDLEDEDQNLESNAAAEAGTTGAATAVDMSGRVAAPPRFETETHLPDGSIQREVETIHPDGTKTVTKTIEQPDGGGGGDKDDDDADLVVIDVMGDDEEQPSQ